MYNITSSDVVHVSFMHS